ncbi:hypothetical protein [Streptomyces griseosporeus]|uniref:hypothetical protein n=1 Tax=Streptomyces griseosporeus TaxID=1910 RepID=UPI0037006DB6
MSAAWIAGLSIPGIYLLAGLSMPLLLWWERRRPSAYSRRPEVLAEWRGMSTEAQAAHDNAVLDAEEAAEEAARRAGQRAVEDAARTNALYRP